MSALCPPCAALRVSAQAGHRVRGWGTPRALATPGGRRSVDGGLSLRAAGASVTASKQGRGGKCRRCRGVGHSPGLRDGGETDRPGHGLPTA